jgi:hypothetical protein
LKGLLISSQESQQLRQQVRELQNKGNLDRNKAHLMRLKAGDDVVAASQDLKQVRSIHRV